MKTPMLIVAIIIGLLVAFVGYSYLSQPQPMSERIDNAATELGAGNLGEAVDEAGNETRGDQLKDDLNDATAPLTEPTPAPAAQ